MTKKKIDILANFKVLFFFNTVNITEITFKYMLFRKERKKSKKTGYNIHLIISVILSLIL